MFHIKAKLRTGPNLGPKELLFVCFVYFFTGYNQTVANHGKEINS